MKSFLKIGVMLSVLIFALIGIKLSGSEGGVQIHKSEITCNKIITATQAPLAAVSEKTETPHNKIITASQASLISVSEKTEIVQYKTTGIETAAASESRGENKSKSMEENVIEELVPKNVKFQQLHISDVSGDKNGDLWVTTGADSIFKINGKTYESTAVGLPENEGAVCVACDPQNRIWVGTVCDGVFIFNGVEWRQLTVMDGLAGMRIFTIEVSPEGNVWIATENGISVWHPADDRWEEYSRIDGFEDNHVVGIAFDDRTVHLAFACGGVAVGSLKSDRYEFKTTLAPWFFDSDQRAPFALSPEGKGLPCNLMNGIAVRAGKGEVYAGSQRGLAASDDRGRSWRFLHGKDYISRVKGLLDADKLKWDAPSGDALEELLPEDVITAVHADETGVWVGFQTQGAALLDPVTLRVKKRVRAFDDKYLRVTSFFRHVDGRLFCATWGKGLFTLAGASVKINRIDVKNGSNFPSAAPVPTPKAIQNRMTSLEKMFDSKVKTPWVGFLGDDWSTKGNWCGRYGINYAMMCAANAPFNNAVCHLKGYRSTAYLGPLAKSNDDFRLWCEKPRDDQNRNVICNPTCANRVMSSWDDHGEAYHKTLDGPDLWILVMIPDTQRTDSWLVSLYFHNPKNYHYHESQRDYLVEAHAYESKLPKNILLRDHKTFNPSTDEIKLAQDIRNVIKTPVAARSRVSGYGFGGVWKHFVVTGASSYYFRIARNGSFNTEICGVHISPWYNGLYEINVPDTAPDNYDCNHPPEYNAPFDPFLLSVSDSHPEVSKLWALSKRKVPYTKQALYALNKTHRDLARYDLSLDTSSVPDGWWPYQLNLWPKSRQKNYWKNYTAHWEYYQKFFTSHRSNEIYRYGHNTIPFTMNEVSKMNAAGINWKDYLPGGKPKYNPKELRKILPRLVVETEIKKEKDRIELYKKEILEYQEILKKRDDYIARTLMPKLKEGIPELEKEIEALTLKREELLKQEKESE